MIVLLFFAFVSGLGTILAPCIWPILPIILSSSTKGGKRRPLGITLGVSTSFAFFTLTLSYIVRIIPIDPNNLRLIAALVIGFLGLMLIIPRLSLVVEGNVSRLVGRLNPSYGGDGFIGGFITGFCLGIVWSPCAGPILATIATLAATREVNAQIILVTGAYVVGIGVPLFIFAEVGSRLFAKSRFMSKYTGSIQKLFGAIMITTAFLIFTNYDKVIQLKLLDLFPSYSGFVNTFESRPAVKKQLNLLKNKATTSPLPLYGQAPEFAGITKWLNVPNGSSQLTMKALRGKVVLVDFWTYTCINCIRTLPHVTDWYEKYKNKGFVVVGVHTPEFLVEHDTKNIAMAAKLFHISYPIAQDNDWATWRAFGNDSWPAEYLIDAKGIVRHVHLGEDAYEETETAIQTLLKEAGYNISEPISKMKDETPTKEQTPETYLGSKRIDRFESPEAITGKKQLFTIPQTLASDSFAYGGEWTVGPEEVVAGKGASIELQFTAGKVFLVITPKNSGDKIKVFLDGKSKEVATLDMPRLYTLIDLKGIAGKHRLRLEFPTGTAVYAFTFGS